MPAPPRYHVVVIEPEHEGPVRRAAMLASRNGEVFYKTIIHRDDRNGMTVHEPLHEPCTIEIPVAVFNEMARLAGDLTRRLERKAAAL